MERNKVLNNFMNILTGIFAHGQVFGPTACLLVQYTTVEW